MLIISIILTILKLLGVINLPWWIIFIPIYIVGIQIIIYTAKMVEAHIWYNKAIKEATKKGENRTHRKCVEIDVDEFKTETEKSYLFVIKGKEIWIPKSVCEELDVDENGGFIYVQEWFAEQEDLI